MKETALPIQMAARLTGLSPYVIRIWEQRYRAVEPSRTPTKRRLFSQADLERLSLLRDATHAGHSIGRVARLPDDDLRALTRAAAALNGHGVHPTAASPAGNPLLDECMTAIRALDTRAFEERLKHANTTLGAQGVLQRLIAPLSQKLGELWREGDITAAHEHFATGMMRGFLTNLAKPFGGSQNSPALMVATPVGQMHELGALLVAGLAANLGWQVTYLGASLPAAEIAGAARQKQARAVALSLVYPEDDPALAGELHTLRDLLPAEVALIVGGRALPAYRANLEPFGVVQIEDLAHVGAALDRLRASSRKVNS
jgi:MerR family transcriptional regulator, light-induced transcriptional regulator